MSLILSYVSIISCLNSFMSYVSTLNCLDVEVCYTNKLYLP